MQLNEVAHIHIEKLLSVLLLTMANVFHGTQPL